MPVQGNQPSPQRQTVLTFVSPNVQDLLFFETVDAQRVGKTPPTYGTAHPDTANFPNHILAYVKQADPNGQFYYYYYANTRASQDEYNFEYSQSSLGQTKFDTVVRTYVTLRSEFTEDDSSLTAGSEMPTAPSAANFSGKGYALMSRVQKRLSDRELDGVFVVEQRTYFVREDIETLKWDDLSHRNLKSTLSYYYTGETPSGAGATIDALVVDSDNSWWQTEVVTNSGISVASYREGRQISSDWFEVIKKEVIAGTADGSNILVDTYMTSMDHSFPPVLESIQINAWERHDGQLLVFPEYNMNPEAYRGPCRVEVKVRWSANKFDSSNGGEPAAKAMIPQSFQFSTPYFRINVPPCLMNGGELTATTGNVDPVYKYAIYRKKIPVTTPPSRPESLVVRDKQEPARGGFVRQTWTVFAPSF
tara:strand:- start:1169 stop:2428 length:1260 start_codon:yes stop_codon:yes gene_type:complete